MHTHYTVRAALARALALLLVFAALLPLTALGEGAAQEAGRWELEADEMDKYLDTAFELFVEGKNSEAVANVGNAYFKVYDIGFERRVLSYISGPRKNATELLFSTCKGLLKKDSDSEEARLEARTAINKLKGMIREDANKLSVIDGYRSSELKYYYQGEQVSYDPWAQYGGDPNAASRYASWTEAAEAMDELFDTANSAYKSLQFDSALDNVNTAFYSVYEESGLSHKIFTDLSLEDREEVDALFLKLKDIANGGRENLKISLFKKTVDKLQTALGKKAASLDAAAAEAKAAETADAEGGETEAAASDPKALTFLAAFGIIVREGLEAILVIAAIIAYLVKSGNARNLRNVYIGAIAGIAASFAAAALLAWLKSAWAGAGQSQEVIEGITALIAVCVLFYVSNWMISKAEAASWSRYIDGKVQGSVERGSAFALAFTAFLSVFREGAEVVLFYQPMLSEGNPGMVWAGFGAGCVVLVFVYLAITKLSIKLPIKVFFTATSILMAIMCVSFLGSGIKELAEGGVFDVTLRVPGIPENDVLQVLGIYPFLETLVPQLILAIILLVTFLIAHYRGKMDALRAEYAAK